MNSILTIIMMAHSVNLMLINCLITVVFIE